MRSSPPRRCAGSVSMPFAARPGERRGRVARASGPDMMEPLVIGAYRGAMAVVAAGAGLASRLPGASARWRGLGDRLGRLGPDERTLASGGTALWLHAASVGELVAARPLLRRLRLDAPSTVRRLLD